MATLKDRIIENYTHEELTDICTTGASGGFSGITYYSETSALYDEYHKEIWQMLAEDAADQGVSIITLITSFGGSKDVANDVTFKNLLVWWAFEKIAYEITECDEEEEEEEEEEVCNG